ncbi:hypothetical protein ACS0TY_019292 [Phlomoides rotata]
MNAKNVQEALQKESQSGTIFGSFVQSCVQLRDLFQRCIFSYVPRSANAMTHNFARVSRSYSSSHTWVEPPAFVDGLLQDFCLNCK